SPAFTVPHFASNVTPPGRISLDNPAPLRLIKNIPDAVQLFVGGIPAHRLNMPATSPRVNSAGLDVLTEDLRYVPGDLSWGRGIPAHLALKRLPQIRGIVFRTALLAPHYGLVQVAEQLLPTGAVFGLVLAPPQVAFLRRTIHRAPGHVGHTLDVGDHLRRVRVHRQQAGEPGQPLRRLRH